MEKLISRFFLKFTALGMKEGIKKNDLQLMYPELFVPESGYELVFTFEDFLVRAQWINPVAPTKRNGDPLFDLKYKSPTLGLNKSGGFYGSHRYDLKLKLAIYFQAGKEGPVEVKKSCDYINWIKEHLEAIIESRKILTEGEIFS